MNDLDLRNTSVGRRFRTKSVNRQLQAALDAAQELDGAQPDELTVSRMKLVQSRLDVLSKIQGRQRVDKVQKLKQELAGARVEIESLKTELAAARIQIERLSSTQTQRVNRLDVDTKLKEIEAEYYGSKTCQAQD